MINVAVEGESDRGAAEAVVAASGGTVARVVVAGGKTKLDPKIAKYCAAARQVPWVVFRDSDGQCPVELRSQLASRITTPNSKFALRIAHSMTEAWLMADTAAFARFFRISAARVPSDPEALAHAKHSLLRLCEASSSRVIRRDVVSPDGQTGPLYVSRLNEFALGHWNVGTAAENSPSLARAVAAIRTLT